ncbi:hypothetical protein GCM10022381_25710 [Leifsonia kafniensis]|uniref:IclR family transcriptional regulator n=1 Tax=Leifsonia kafniensis TaxID=475957 RepID=A0ABP7KML5_9MICO
MTEISKTANKALALLTELAASGPSTPQEIARRLDINRTVTQRLLMTLYARDFVRREGGSYTISPRMRRMADAVLPQLRPLVGRLDAELAEATGETVVFKVVDGDTVIVLDEAVPSAVFDVRARHEVGTRSDITQSASGLAILSAMDDDELKRTLRGTGEDLGVVGERIAEARRAGYAVTSGELQEGVTGIAAPVSGPDGVVGSVAVLIPTMRANNLTELHRLLMNTVTQMEYELRQPSLTGGADQLLSASSSGAA